MSTKRALTRADLEQMPSYAAARTADQIALEHGIDRVIRMASNENPFGLLPGVEDAFHEAASIGHRYPDILSHKLRKKLAERFHVDSSHVLAGCGSVSLCEHIATACAGPGDDIVFPWRSFEAYPLIATRTGAKSVPVPIRDNGALDVQGLIAAITPATRLIFVCTPNNPTAHALQREELAELVAAIPSDVLIVIDEAYAEFITDSSAASGLDHLGQENVVVLRTFSKAWGLAGARCGYFLGPPDIVETVGKILPPFSVSTFAQAGALAALKAESEMRRRVEIITTERTRLGAHMEPLVPGTVTGQANFLWLPLKDESAAFVKACEEEGVIVRGFPGLGVRVTIGTPEENSIFLEVVTKIMTKDS